MYQRNYLAISIILTCLFLLLGPSFDASARPLAATSPVLGASASYSVLAGSTITNIGSTTINGDIGVAAGTAITGFPPGIVGPPGVIHFNDASAIAAQADNLIVFGTLDQPCDQTFGAVDLTVTFPSGVGPGVYCSTSTFSLTGNLNLVGSGVWVFKTVSTLITSPGSSITGGDPCNTWWRIGTSATLDTNTSFVGSIFALTDITMNTGATLNGRALVQTGQVILQSSTITGPVCNVLATDTPTATGTATAILTPTSTSTAVPTDTPSVPTSTPSVPTSTPSVPTDTPPVSTDTPAPTATLLPIVTGLPDTGGAPIRHENSSWGFIIFVGLSVMAVLFGIRVYRHIYGLKQ